MFHYRMWTLGLFTILIVLSTAAFLRLLAILPSINPTRPLPRKRGNPAHLLVVLGSGGHTAEMFALLRGIDFTNYSCRTYIVSAGDSFSATKAAAFEERLKYARQAPKSSSYLITIVPRARRIHQPLYTTPVSAFKCLASCLSILYTNPPDLIMTNGPGTAVCVILAALILRFFAVRGTRGKMRTIYVESWARVRRLSLSGRLLLPVVDRFLVQWEALKAASPRAEYIGVLV
ncbi:MAG: UDP-N-acetylglucosamine transferase subunit [Trizodia sp. TS-e1964]|nr:MAG: UDP-N-acetylglucosamine transferase subunit [Trizodia sp. TS-e1964]